ADRDGDPHSPNLPVAPGTSRLSRGLFHAYIGWIVRHEVPNANHYARDLLGDPHIARVHRWYYGGVAIGPLVPTAAGALALQSAAGALHGLVWGGLVRMFAGHNMIWWITSFAHRIGSRDYACPDLSTNNAWIALPTLGEGWHNNHHSFPRAA